MRAIKGSGTGPERALLRACWRLGLRPRIGGDGLPGRPDLRFPAARLAVFVHGDFWHGCPRHYRAPWSNRAFWRSKLEGNRRRDARVRRALNRAGWRVATVWEHEEPATAAGRIAGRLRRPWLGAPTRETIGA